MEKKNQEQVNFIWKPLCIIFAAFLTLSWVFFGFLYSKGGVDFSSLQNSVVNTDATVTDGDGNVLDSGKVHALPKALVFSGELSDNAYQTIRVEAIVKPDYAIDKRVDWEIRFRGGSWAEGKNVTDFVTITPLGDGSRFADITCHAAFAVPIEIVVRSRANFAAYADCQIDFQQKYLGLKFFFENQGNQYPDNFLEWFDAKKVSADKPVLTNKVKAFYQENPVFNFRAERLFSSVYTLPLETKNLGNLKIKMTEEFLWFLRDNGYNPPDSVINYSDIIIDSTLEEPQKVENVPFLDMAWFATVSDSKYENGWEELAIYISQFSSTAYQFLLFREDRLDKPISTFDVVIDLSLILAPTNITVDPPEVVL